MFHSFFYGEQRKYAFFANYFLNSVYLYIASSLSNGAELFKTWPITIRTSSGYCFTKALRQNSRTNGVISFKVKDNI